MNLAQTIDAMMAADCTREQIAAVVHAEQAAADARAAGKKQLAAKRQAAYRERQREAKAACDASNANGASRPVTERHIASNAQAPAREEVLTSLDSKNPSKENPPKGGQKKGFPPSADTHPRKNRTQLSEDAKPSERDRAVAEREGMWPATIDHQWSVFVSKSLANGNTYLNWHQAWVTWVKHWVGYGRKQIGSPPLRLAETGDKRVFVIRGSPQWTAWTAYLGKPKPVTQRGQDEGWYFESEWPPDATITSTPPLPKLDEASTSSCSASEREGQGRQATEARFAFSR